MKRVAAGVVLTLGLASSMPGQSGWQDSGKHEVLTLWPKGAPDAQR